MFFDTHAHLLSAQFDADRAAVLERAHEAGVGLILEAGTTAEDSAKAVAFANAQAGVYAAAGVHPHEARHMDDDTLGTLRALLADARCVAVGEIGLDYHYDFSPRDAQLRAFDAQLGLAEDADKPVIIHNREAHADILRTLEAYKGRVRGVLHCYSGSVEDAKKYLDMGFYLSFGGPLTFHNAKRPRAVAAYAPLDRLLIETDCPYLTPTPHRGQRNEPMHVRLVAGAMAQIKGVAVEDVAEATTQNGIRLFALPQAGAKG